MVLDLSAPKLLIPENFEDKNAAIIVVDFGKFLLTNQPGDHAPGHTRSASTVLLNSPSLFTLDMTEVESARVFCSSAGAVRFLI